MTENDTIETKSLTVRGPQTSRQVHWPRKYDLFGVQVSATSYEEATASIIEAAQSGTSAMVSAHAVHAVVSASDDLVLQAKVNRFHIVTPDGQPVRWALNALHKTKLQSNVRGSELMLSTCRAAAKSNVSIFLYGSSPDVIEPLCANLKAGCLGLNIAGTYCPPFRPLTAAEEADVVQRINGSGAGIVFIGLGCPKQDHFAYDMHDRLNAVLVCVGAAFDFHAGMKQTAPRWMQKAGLEWIHRLACEPGRLWRRYLTTNSAFIGKFLHALIRRR